MRRLSLAGLYKAAWVIDGVAWLARLWLLAGVLLVVLVLMYAWSLNADPWKVCLRCGGWDTSSQTGSIFTGAVARGCKSPYCYDGHRLRWGVRVFQRARARDLTESYELLDLDEAAR